MNGASLSSTMICGLATMASRSASAEWYSVPKYCRSKRGKSIMLLTVASTCSNMPYGAMKACITPDATDHAKTGGLRMMFANVASMLTLIIAVPLITSLGDGPATGGALLAALNYVANTQQTPAGAQCHQPDHLGHPVRDLRGQRHPVPLLSDQPEEAQGDHGRTDPPQNRHQLTSGLPAEMTRGRKASFPHSFPRTNPRNSTVPGILIIYAVF